MEGSDPFRKLGIAVLVLVGAVINIGFLIGFVYEAIWLIEELGLWWALALHGGVFVFVGLVVWDLIGDFLVDKWGYWRYWNIYRRDEELPASAARNSSMPARGSFAALVEAERSTRQGND